MDAFKAIDEFLTWQFWVSCLAVQALVWMQRTVMAQVSPRIGGTGWWRAILTVSNVAWGVAVAAVPGYLKGDTFAQRAVLGVAIGLVSQFVYHLLLKRWLDRLGPHTGPTPGQPELAPTERKTPKDHQVGGP